MKTLRLAQESELQEIMDLYEAVKGREFCPWDDSYPNWDTIMVDYCSQCLYVYAEGETICGVVSTSLENELDDKPFWHSPRGSAREIYRVAVSPAYQGQGLAAEMISDLEELMAAAGVGAVHLLAIRANLPACKTYARLGYAIVGECDEYGHHYDAYEKLLWPGGVGTHVLPAMSLQGLTVLSRLKDEVSALLGGNLVGIYLHGSLAQGTFSWAVSDIDYLIVVENEPSEAMKRQLMALTLSIDAMAPAKGLEMSVVLRHDCHKVVHPMPFCLHYSHMHTEWYQRDAVDYIRKMRGTDADLVSYAEMIRCCGLVLVGAPVNEVFGDIPAAYVLDSFRQNIVDGQVADVNQPRYLVYQTTGKMLSKIIKISDHLEVLFHAVGWFCKREQLSEDDMVKCMLKSIGKKSGVPQWYVVTDGEAIVAGCKVMNETMALQPSDVYVEPAYRGIGLEHSIISVLCPKR